MGQRGDGVLVVEVGGGIEVGMEERQCFSKWPR